MSIAIQIPCPTCSGDGFATTGDRHCETRTDVCRTCGGEGTIPANTGQSREASADPSTGEAPSPTPASAYAGLEAGGS